MHLPSQGFRHAATLLLSNGIRTLPHDGSPALIAEVLIQLARELVALAVDTRASADAREWTTSEYCNALDRVVQTFSHRSDADFTLLFQSIQVRGIELLDDLGKHQGTDIEPRDLFMMYVPEDRLPIAAPLAIELTKRRFTVAFSDFEIATSEQMNERLEYGACHHRAGILLVTSAFLRRAWRVPQETDRFRLVKPADRLAIPDGLAKWLAASRV
jgi:hypothetical protein